MYQHPMKTHRISDPKSLSLSALAILLANGADKVVIQFSEPSTYEGAILTRLNEACQGLGTRVNVRFFGHYGTNFDCRTLRQIPAVRSLDLDFHAGITCVNELGSLNFLEELAFGVFESDIPKLLEIPTFMKLQKLVLLDSRKNNVDLSPLASCRNLEELFIHGHARHIEVLAGLQSVKSLGLRGMAKKQSLQFVSAMASLRSFSLWLGSRERLEDVVHTHLRKLEILRVRSFLDLDLKAFPALQTLRIEDQLQLRTLSLEPVSSLLKNLTIFNCKNFAKLIGIEDMRLLQYLYLSKTATDSEDILQRLPKSLKRLAICGSGTKQNADIAQRVMSLGLEQAVYMQATES
jgi:hypothetical protein